MAQRTQLTGARELEAVLKQLPKEIGEKVLVAATRAGANVVRKDALARLEAGGVSKRGGPRNDPALVIVRDRKSAASVTLKLAIHKRRFYLMFREFGTAPHSIRAGKARRGAGVLERTFGGRATVLANPETGEVFGPEVQHPGQPARPFLRPAFDGKAGAAVDAIGVVLGKKIEQAALKLAGSFAKSGLSKRRRR